MADTPIDETMEVIIRAGSTSNNEMEVESDGLVTAHSDSAKYAKDLKGYNICSNINISSSGTETNLILITNPNGNSKTIYLDDIIVNLRNTVGSEVFIKLYASPTVTANGTALNISPWAIGASQPASSIRAYSSPTTSARGTQMFEFFLSASTGSQSFQYDFDLTIVLAPNSSILISGQADGTNRSTTTTLNWIEK
jgi:hypothetical protein